MNIDDIESLIELMKKHGVEEFALDREDGKRVMFRFRNSNTELVSQNLPKIEKSSCLDLKLEALKSPIIGTFYTSEAPGRPQLAKVGQKVTVDTPVCIIEAMKVMNEVTAGVNGTIRAIHVSNGVSVGYNDLLMEIEAE